MFGTLTVDEVIANADTALAVAALPIFGAAGYTMISIAALFSTTGAINSRLYASIGATYTMAKDGTLPPAFGLKGRRREGGTQGLVISALLILALVLLFDVTAIASIGSAVALSIFALMTVAHLRMAKETGASKFVLVLALIATSVAILLVAWNTWLTSPQTFVILVVTIILAWVVEAISLPTPDGRHQDHRCDELPGTALRSFGSRDSHFARNGGACSHIDERHARNRFHQRHPGPGRGLAAGGLHATLHCVCDVCAGQQR